MCATVPQDPGRRTALRRRLGIGVLVALLSLTLGGPAQSAPLSTEEALHAPVGRFGTLPAPYTLRLLRTPMVDPADPGEHDHRTHANEAIGIAYTCRAGFLDMDHVRDAADWTAFLYARFLLALQARAATVAFSGSERQVRFQVRLAPPAPSDEARLPGLALALARRHAFWVLSWHELLTWYGYRTVPLVSEKSSAFSYEDTSSHLVGLEVAELALARPEPWNLAVQQALRQELQALGAVPPDTTREALNRVRSRWWNPAHSWPSNAFIGRRHLDIGLAGDLIMPWVVAGLPACAGVEAVGLRIAAPVLDGVLQATEVEPVPARAWPAATAASSSPPRDSARLPDDLPALMAELTRRVRAELGPGADQPDAPAAASAPRGAARDSAILQDSTPRVPP